MKVLNNFKSFKFSSQGIWATAQLHRPETDTKKSVTLIPGIGIGP